jgi:DNA-binding response OmpR family regulator
MKRILIADSNDDSLEILGTFLRKNNYDVLTTRRPTTIFKLLSRFHPSIIILRAPMGRYDVNDLCREIKRHKNSGDIQLLMIVDKKFNPGSSQYECDDIIMQPLDTSLILEKLLLCESGLY